MLDFLRNGKIIVLAVLLILGTVLGAAHQQAQESGSSFFVTNAVRTVLKPFQAVVSGISRAFDSATRSMRVRSALRKENATLREEVKQLNMEALRLREDAAEAKRLRAALAFKEQSPEELVSARIISRNASEWFATATIDRGRKSGVKPGHAIITHRGFVGQVFEVSPTTSQIRVLTDGRSGVGGMVQRSRAAGICQGQDSELLHLTYLANDADVVEGDIIVTSGQGGVVPKGLPIGRVVTVQMESGGFMKSAMVAPSVRFDSVEEVFVVIREVE